jgi:hypothetical protein
MTTGLLPGRYQPTGDTMPRPELGKLTVGDQVIVIQPIHRGAPHMYDATVTKVARVWIDLVEVTDRTYPRVWRMRMNNQTDGGTTGIPTRFVTAEQYAWEQREKQARDYLREIRVEVWRGPWNNDQVTFANLIRTHEGLEPF